MPLCCHHDNNYVPHCASRLREPPVSQCLGRNTCILLEMPTHLQLIKAQSFGRAQIEAAGPNSSFSVIQAEAASDSATPYAVTHPVHIATLDIVFIVIETHSSAQQRHVKLHVCIAGNRSKEKRNRVCMYQVVCNGNACNIAHSHHQRHCVSPYLRLILTLAKVPGSSSLACIHKK